MDPKEIARTIVEEVESSLNEESKETQSSNVSNKRKDADSMPSVEGEDMDGEENSGSDSKSKQASSTGKYKSSSVSEEKEVGSDVEDSEDESDNTVADTDPETTEEPDESDSKRDRGLTSDTGVVSEESDEGDEEEPEDEDEDYGEEAIRQKVEEHLKSAEAGEAIREHLQAMFKTEDDQLTEEFTNKARSIFEGAINERTRSIVSLVIEENTRILESKMEKLEEEAHLREEELVNQIDEYLTHVCEEWMEENELQVESGLRSEISEEFMSDLNDLLREHNINIPEEKFDVLEEAIERSETLESELNEMKEKEARLNRQLKEEKRNRIFMEETSDLTVTEREKLVNLSEHLDCQNEEKYTRELKTIKESYFSGSSTSDVNNDTAVDLNEEIKRENDRVRNPELRNLLEGMNNFSEKS